MATEAQAGWYDDGSGTMRWWDGARWTENVLPPAPVPAPEPIAEPTPPVTVAVPPVVEPAAVEAPVAVHVPVPAPAAAAMPVVSAPAVVAQPAVPQAIATVATAPAAASGQAYVVLQIILKEKLWGTGSGNLTELEHAINRQAAKGYRLHTISTASSGSKGLAGGDRIQATLVFERLG